MTASLEEGLNAVKSPMQTKSLNFNGLNVLWKKAGMAGCLSQCVKAEESDRVWQA